MPLTATFDPGHNHYPSENVYFYMRDCDRRIRCGISEFALEVIDPKFERSKEGRLVAFNKHRAHIESVASAKYDGGEMERDGRTILVSAADIERHLSDASGRHGERNRGSPSHASAELHRQGRSRPTSFRGPVSPQIRRGRLASFGVRYSNYPPYRGAFLFASEKREPSAGGPIPAEGIIGRRPKELCSSRSVEEAVAVCLDCQTSAHDVTFGLKVIVICDIAAHERILRSDVEMLIFGTKDHID